VLEEAREDEDDEEGGDAEEGAEGATAPAFYGQAQALRVKPRRRYPARTPGGGDAVLPGLHVDRVETCRPIHRAAAAASAIGTDRRTWTPCWSLSRT